MSSLSWQRQNSRSKRLARELGPTVTTLSYREKLQIKLRRLDLPNHERTRIAAMIQDDPVAAHKEIKAWETLRK